MAHPEKFGSPEGDLIIDLDDIVELSATGVHFEPCFHIRFRLKDGRRFYFEEDWANQLYARFLAVRTMSVEDMTGHNPHRN